MTPLTILHAEDFKAVADAVRDECAERGWRVVTCTTGSAAYNWLAGKSHFDLFITDNGLADLSGLEVVRSVRTLPHRARMPIIMYTASECEREAHAAGVDVFLRKPADLYVVINTVARLLHQGA